MTNKSVMFRTECGIFEVLPGEKFTIPLTPTGLLDAYYDWENNFFTVERFAEHYAITADTAEITIVYGRILHEAYAEWHKAVNDIPADKLTVDTLLESFPKTTGTSKLDVIAGKIGYSEDTAAHTKKFGSRAKWAFEWWKARAEKAVYVLY